MNKVEFLHRFQHPRTVHPEPDFPLTEPGQRAVVLVPIIETKNALSLLLTERAHHLTHHPGQISFPGGKIEAGDRTLKDTAARETFEEVGIPQDKLEWIGRLPNYRTVSRYEIIPFIAFIKGPVVVKVDPNEVSSVFEIPLEKACNPYNHSLYPFKRDGFEQNVYFIPFENYLIWGATAAIIRNLGNHLYDMYTL